MLQDDANAAFFEILKQLLEIFKNMSNGSRANSRGEKVPKTPKIKCGSISKRELDKLRKSGMKFKYVTVPAEKLDELEKTVKDLGGSFFATKLADGNNVILAVPEQYESAVSLAAQRLVSDILVDDPGAIALKNGDSKISEEDMKLTADVLRSHDIPVYSFKSSKFADGKYMNAVPKEVDGQYEAAMKEVKDIKNQLDNIEVTRYEQTAPLDELDFCAESLTEDEARELQAAAAENNLDVKIAKTETGPAAYYSPEIADAVKKARDDYQNSLEESEKYLIDITDDTITMDVDTLVLGEDDNSYFVRVPNTAAQDYLRLDKSEVDVINDGKTLSMQLDMGKYYNIYSEDGRIKSLRQGAELSQCYNTKHKHVNKDTQVLEFGEKFRRVELYNKEKNQLISIGITSAEQMKTELLKLGITAKTADKLLDDINKKLPENYTEIFSYPSEKSEIVYADIPNIGEYLAQSQLSQQVIGKAECYGEIPKDSGSKCCIFDKTANKFAVMPVLPRNEVMNKLTEMGYSEISAKEIADKIVGSYRDVDFPKIIDEGRDNTIPETTAFPFLSRNSELSELSYCIDGNSAIIVKDCGEDFKYMDIDKGISLPELEKSLIKNFDIKDVISAAEIMKELETMEFLDTPKSVKVEDVEVSQVSPSCVEISKGEKSVITPNNKIDSGRLSEIGVTEKEITSIKNSLEKSEKAASHPEKQTLQSIKNIAAGLREKNDAAKEHKTAEKNKSAEKKAGEER